MSLKFSCRVCHYFLMLKNLPVLFNKVEIEKLKVNFNFVIYLETRASVNIK